MADSPEGAIDLLVDRAAGSSLAAGPQELLLTAAVGGEELADALGGGPARRPSATRRARSAPSGVFLAEIAVEGFRGVAGRARLGFPPAPGLTLVVGRNGSGKSSFSEAAELALTGTASRWEARSKVWEEGWANLHHDGPRSVEVRLTEDGVAGQIAVCREWSVGAGLHDASAWMQRPGQPRRPTRTLGLEGALSTWRPFLSYNELGGLLDEGPSRLYDAISRVLGLEEWAEVEQRLDAARRQLEADVKAARAEAERLRGVLASQADDRAAAALAAMPVRKGWDLPAVEKLATGGTGTPGNAALEALAALMPVDVAEASARAAALQTALSRSAAVAASDAGRARELASLLESSLDAHAHHGGTTCPVCATPGVLDEAWAARTRSEVDRLRNMAADAEMAEEAAQSAELAARLLLTPPPAAVLGGSPGVDTGPLAERWSQWAKAPEGAVALALHLEGSAPGLASAIDEVRAAASAELRRRQDAWQPVAAQLAAWLPSAREVQLAEPRIADLKAAVKWIAEEANRVRNERFAPVAARVQELWELLRHTSNVSLDSVTLGGTRTRRRVELAVSVDETEGAALSVMSQGELHALALSLFLPRATLADSPFRFVVIDDPVQAMDEARVDGLARVLAEVARTHQVVVLTHDERLPEAARRLDLKARVLEVCRGERSEVTIRSRRHPVDDYLSDARAVLSTDDYPETARRRVVPGLCRNAVEAACDETTRRRLLAQGVALREVDDAIEGAGRLFPRLALAILGDADRAGEVLAEINRRFGGRAGDTVRALNTGAHQLIDDDPRGLIAGTEQLAHAILRLQ